MLAGSAKANIGENNPVMKNDWISFTKKNESEHGYIIDREKK